MLNENKADPSKFWSIVKKMFPKAQPSNKDSHPDNNGKVNIFSEWFSSVVHKLKTKAMPLLDFIWKTPNNMKLRTEASFEFNYVPCVFVLKQLKALKDKKATGLDNLPSALLKDCADVIAGPLSHRINLFKNWHCYTNLEKKYESLHFISLAQLQHAKTID